jgi:AhpC/TSA family
LRVIVLPMKRALLVLGAVAVLGVLAFPANATAQGGAAPAAQAPPPPPPSVKEGQPMPDFTLPYLEPARDGGRPTPKTVKLSELKGNVVVLAFFPAAFSPG